MKLVLALGIVFSVLVQTAAGTVSPPLLKPAAMAVKIHGATPQLAGNNYSAPSSITATVCRGLGTARPRGYATFRCAATWSGGTATVWARALPGARFCASAFGLASCPPAPRDAGDPRVCSNPAPVFADPDRCALAGAELGLIRAMKVQFGDPSWTVRNLTCDGKNVTWTCQFSSSKVFGIYYRSAIKFSDSGGWTETLATTTVNGASAAVTCTASPGVTPAGTASRWDTGVVPVCAQ